MTKRNRQPRATPNCRISRTRRGSSTLTRRELSIALLKYTSGVPVQHGRRRGATFETWAAAAILSHPGELVVGEFDRRELVPVGFGFLLRTKAGAGFRAFDGRDQIVNQCSRVHGVFLELEFLPAELLSVRCGTLCTELPKALNF